jgi:hypothetical protein
MSTGLAGPRLASAAADQVFAALADPTRRRDGREVVFTVHPERLVATASWMTSVAASWQQRLQLLKQATEAADHPDPG